MERVRVAASRNKGKVLSGIVTLLLAPIVVGIVVDWATEDESEPTPVATTEPQKPLPPSVTLEPIDLRISGRNGQRNPVLDLKVRNSGTAVAFVKRARIVVLAATYVDDCIAASEEPSSATYDVELPYFSDVAGENLPTTVTADLSQSIQPNAVDRFSLRLGHNLSEYYGAQNLYQLAVDLIEGAPGAENVVKMGRAIAAVPFPAWDDSAEACAAASKQVVQGFLKRDGVRSRELMKLADSP